VSETNPYAAPEVPVQQEEQAVIGFDVTLVLASRTQRFFTLLLDSLLRAGLVFCITVGFVLLFPDYGEKLERMSKLDEWMTEIFSLMLFYCFFEGIWQRSPARLGADCRSQPGTDGSVRTSFIFWRRPIRMA
jgi:hypothetical protein